MPGNQKLTDDKIHTLHSLQLGWQTIHTIITWVPSGNMDTHSLLIIAALCDKNIGFFGSLPILNIYDIQSLWPIWGCLFSHVTFIQFSSSIKYESPFLPRNRVLISNIDRLHSKKAILNCTHSCGHRAPSVSFRHWLGVKPSYKDNNNQTNLSNSHTILKLHKLLQ